MVLASEESISTRREQGFRSGSGISRRLDLDGWLHDDVDARRAAVRYPGLTPHLDRERDGHQRGEQPEEVPVLVGDAVELNLAEVLRARLETGERGVVERLKLVHRARETLGVAVELARERPVGEGLEVRERDRQSGH